MNLIEQLKSEADAQVQRALGHREAVDVMVAAFQALGQCGFRPNLRRDDNGMLALRVVLECGAVVMIGETPVDLPEPVVKAVRQPPQEAPPAAPGDDSAADPAEELAGADAPVGDDAGEDDVEETPEEAAEPVSLADALADLGHDAPWTPPLDYKFAALIKRGTSVVGAGAVLLIDSDAAIARWGKMQGAMARAGADIDGLLVALLQRVVRAQAAE